MSEIFKRAIRQNDFDTVSRFLENHKFLKENIDNQFLYSPSKRGQFDMVVLLLSKSNNFIDKNQVNLCITYAAQKGHIQIVELFLSDYRIDFSSFNFLQTPNVAVKNGHIDIVKMFFKYVNVEKIEDSIILHSIDSAYEEDHFHILKFLLDIEIVEKKLQKYNLELYNYIITDLLQNKIKEF